MPPYEILNEFQKGHSHMAVVIEHSNQEHSSSDHATHAKDWVVDIYGERHPNKSGLRRKRSLRQLKSVPHDATSQSGSSTSKRWSNGLHSEILHIDDKLPPGPGVTQGGKVIGIITLEDVIEELLQEEIFDETDRHGSFTSSNMFYYLMKQEPFNENKPRERNE